MGAGMGGCGPRANNSTTHTHTHTHTLLCNPTPVTPLSTPRTSWLRPDSPSSVPCHPASIAVDPSPYSLPCKPPPPPPPPVPVRALTVPLPVSPPVAAPSHPLPFHSRPASPPSSPRPPLPCPNFHALIHCLSGHLELLSYEFQERPSNTRPQGDIASRLSHSLAPRRRGQARRTSGGLRRRQAEERPWGPRRGHRPASRRCLHAACRGRPGQLNQASHRRPGQRPACARGCEITGRGREVASTIPQSAALLTAPRGPAAGEGQGRDSRRHDGITMTGGGRDMRRYERLRQDPRPGWREAGYYESGQGAGARCRAQVSKETDTAYRKRERVGGWVGGGVGLGGEGVRGW